MSVPASLRPKFSLRPGQFQPMLYYDGDDSMHRVDNTKRRMRDIEDTIEVLKDFDQGAQAFHGYPSSHMDYSDYRTV